MPALLCWRLASKEIGAVRQPSLQCCQSAGLGGMWRRVPIMLRPLIPRHGLEAARGGCTSLFEWSEQQASESVCGAREVVCRSCASEEYQCDLRRKATALVRQRQH
eukprot:1878021-Rhodomonas_salina.3